MEKTLKSLPIETRLGPMLAVADDQALYFLEFIDRCGLKQKFEWLKKKTHSIIVPGYTPIIHSIEDELLRYFAGTLQQFKTPVHLIGTDFEQRVWHELQAIPFGQTRSYAQIAQAIGKPTAYRAVAKANSANVLPILIPCHRVISSDGKLSGYAGGVKRKEWLINHEKIHTIYLSRSSHFSVTASS